MIRAGLPTEATPQSGDWVFVDMGFASGAPSCGLLQGAGDPELMTFGNLAAKLGNIVTAQSVPLNLLLEAPLSVAFSSNGNPRGRSIVKRGPDTRYWYVGLGACVMVAAMYLLRGIHAKSPKQEIRLFEGFASFKPKGIRSSHLGDVIALRRVILEPNAGVGSLVPAERLRVSSTDLLQSALLVGGLDFGIPPVVVIDG